MNGSLRVGLLFVSWLVLASPAQATTWFNSEVDCPVCGSKTTVSEIGSYGSYIYRWPSRCQMLFWPDTDEHAVFRCAHCSYAALMRDFTHLPADKRDAVKKALEGVTLPEATDYTRIPMTTRLAVAEKVYLAWGRTDAEWSHFYRMVAFHAGEEGDEVAAAAARRQALAFAEKVAADPAKAGQRKESLLITATLRSFLGDTEGARRDLSAAAKVAYVNPEKPGNSEGANRYLDEQIADQLEALKTPGEPGEGCQPVCSPACWKRPPLKAWQKLERALLYRTSEELLEANWRGCPKRGDGDDVCPARYETKPALQPRKQWTTLAEVQAQFGAPSRVEPGTFEGKAVKRHFWGPVYLVVSEGKTILAQGLDRVLLAVEQGKKLDGLTYLPQPEQATGSVSVTGSPEGARVEVTEASVEPREAKVPASVTGLPAGTYQVLVEQEGHHRSERRVFVEPGFAAQLEMKLQKVESWEAVPTSAGTTLARLREGAGKAGESTRYEEQLSPKARPTVDQLVAKHGAPREEAGLRKGKPVRLFFWGPVFVGRAGASGPVTFVGIDLRLEQLLRDPAAIDTRELRYRARDSKLPGVCGLEVLGEEEGADVLVVDPSGKKMKGKLPWKAPPTILPGPYQITVTRPGFSEDVETVLVEPGFNTAWQARIWKQGEE